MNKYVHLAKSFRFANIVLFPRSIFEDEEPDLLLLKDDAVLAGGNLKGGKGVDFIKINPKIAKAIRCLGLAGACPHMTSKLLTEWGAQKDPARYKVIQKARLQHDLEETELNIKEFGFPSSLTYMRHKRGERSLDAKALLPTLEKCATAKKGRIPYATSFVEWCKNRQDIIEPIFYKMGAEAEIHFRVIDESHELKEANPYHVEPSWILVPHSVHAQILFLSMEKRTVLFSDAVGVEHIAKLIDLTQDLFQQYWVEVFPETQVHLKICPNRGQSLPFRQVEELAEIISQNEKEGNGRFHLTFGDSVKSIVFTDNLFLKEYWMEEHPGPNARGIKRHERFVEAMVL